MINLLINKYIMDANFELYCEDRAFLDQLRNIINYNNLIINKKKAYKLTKIEICNFFLNKIPNKNIKIGKIKTVKQFGGGDEEQSENEQTEEEYIDDQPEAQNKEKQNIIKDQDEYQLSKKTPINFDSEDEDDPLEILNNLDESTKTNDINEHYTNESENKDKGKGKDEGEDKGKGEGEAKGEDADKGEGEGEGEGEDVELELSNELNDNSAIDENIVQPTTTEGQPSLTEVQPSLTSTATSTATPTSIVAQPTSTSTVVQSPSTTTTTTDQPILPEVQSTTSTPTPIPTPADEATTTTIKPSLNEDQSTRTANESTITANEPTSTTVQPTLTEDKPNIIEQNIESELKVNDENASQIQQNVVPIESSNEAPIGTSNDVPIEVPNQNKPTKLILIFGALGKGKSKFGEMLKNELKENVIFKDGDTIYSDLRITKDDFTKDRSELTITYIKNLIESNKGKGTTIIFSSVTSIFDSSKFDLNELNTENYIFISGDVNDIIDINEFNFNVFYNDKFINTFNSINEKDKEINKSILEGISNFISKYNNNLSKIILYKDLTLNTIKYLISKLKELDISLVN